MIETEKRLLLSHINPETSSLAAIMADAWVVLVHYNVVGMAIMVPVDSKPGAQEQNLSVGGSSGSYSRPVRWLSSIMLLQKESKKLHEGEHLVPPETSPVVLRRLKRRSRSAAEGLICKREATGRYRRVLNYKGKVVSWLRNRCCDILLNS